jgi:hypothetical protein
VESDRPRLAHVMLEVGAHDADPAVRTRASEVARESTR